MKQALLFTTYLFIATIVFAQPGNRDSTRAQGMRYMQTMLKLSNSQVKEITNLTIAEEKKVAQMKGAPLTPEARKKQMEDNYSAYRKAIKKILTKEQWDQYVVFQEKKRNKFVEERKKNKINVKLGKIKE